MDIFDIIVKYRDQLAYGLTTTLALCSIIWPTGIVLGCLLGVAGARWRLAVGIPSRLTSFVMSGVPVLVFLFWLHYPAQYALGIVVKPFYTAAAALSIVNIFLVADLLRGILLDLPSQYIDAARVCGLSSRETVRFIKLPIVARQALPPLLSIQVTMLQSTLFASLISVDEIFRISQRINSEIYRPVEVYTALALLFLAVCLPLHGLAIWLRARYTRNLSER